MKKVFLSYSHADAAFARRLAADLRARGSQVWIDQEEVKVGDSLVGHISDALAETDYVVAVLSRHSTSSQWVRGELEQAEAQRRGGCPLGILPVLLEDCDMPPYLCGRLYADFRQSENYENSLAALVGAIDSIDATSRPNTRSNDAGQHSVVTPIPVPRFYAGQLLRPPHFLRLQQAIILLELQSGLRSSQFTPFQSGQLIHAADLNVLATALAGVRAKLGLQADLNSWPVQSGQLMTSAIFNELVDALNAAATECPHVDFEG